MSVIAAALAWSLATAPTTAPEVLGMLEDRPSVSTPSAPQARGRQAWRSTEASETASVRESVSGPEQDSDALTLESLLANGELDGDTSLRITDRLTAGRPQDVDYLSSVALQLAKSLQRNLTLEPRDALDLAYTTVIDQLLDSGNAESAQYLAQQSLAQAPDSAPIRAALATALAERLYYREAIGVLREIRAPDVRIQAQLAVLLFRQGNTAEATRLATQLRGWSAEAAELMEEIPE